MSHTSKIDPVVWQPPKATARARRSTGPMPMPPLRVLPVSGYGPEDVVIDAAGWLITGVADGRILRLSQDGRTVETVADTGGRPLGLELFSDGALLVCDAERGLLRVELASGAITPLLREIDGVAMRFCNNAAIAADDTVYFTDSSRRFGVHNWRGDLLEHSATGRLCALSPSGELSVLLDGLSFANGVALSHDESSVVVAETGAYRLTRYWLSGARAGSSEVLLDNLPGVPDNISSGSDGVIWVALPSPRNPQLDALLPRPAAIRRLIWSLPQQLQPGPADTVWILGVDHDGRVCYDLQQPGADYRMVTGVREHEGMLYLSSLEGTGLAVLPRPQSPLPGQDAREFALPAFSPPAESGGIADAVFERAHADPEDVAFMRKTRSGWSEVTIGEFRDRVVQAAKGLLAYGIEPGDRVVVMASNSLEWAAIDHAILAIGAVTVAIYDTASARQAEWICSDSGAVLAFVDADAHQQLIAGFAEKTPAMRSVLRLDGAGMEELAAAGAEQSEDRVAALRAAVRPDQLATLCYTSGTTGMPKGCRLSHANFMDSLDNAVELMPELFRGVGEERASTLLFLPLAHVFGRLVQIAGVRSGGVLAYCPDITQVAEDLRSFAPTFVISVPRVFEKVYNSARQRAQSEGKGKIFEAAAETAIAYSQARTTGTISPVLRARHEVFDRLVYRKLREAIGGRARYAISGGGALGERLTHFFRGIGLEIFEGYGLSETSGASVVNSPSAAKPGTVGQPTPGTTVRIDTDGEVLLRGPGVFSGYWNNESDTAEALPDGWFHTGDLGALDAEGYLSITGRKKEILVTAGGKNVAPNVIEDGVQSHPLVSQCLVVGDNRPYVAALITIDEDALQTWASENGKDATAGASGLVDDPDLHAEIQTAVDTGNEAVSRAESIRKFRILPTDFSIGAGQLTPTLKLRRSVVTDDYAVQIGQLYGDA